ncbi:DedA family protein [Brevibacillus reuszeri]|uniref:DedA family protein n=1 Tax=Brevibacillus reuszeri TaxID=54915 RepID=UPI003D1F1649
MASTEFVTLFAKMVKGMVEKPIPDEITVMSLGAQVAHIDAQIFVAFFSIYAGVSLVLASGYIIGGVLGTPIVNWLLERRLIPTGKGRTREERDRFFGWMLCLGFFFPVVRHVIPFFVGAGRLPLRLFCLYFFPSSLIWTFHYYLAGYLFADRMDEMVAGVYTYSKITLIALCSIGLVYMVIRQLQRIEIEKDPKG